MKIQSSESARVQAPAYKVKPNKADPSVQDARQVMLEAQKKAEQDPMRQAMKKAQSVDTVA